MMSCVSRSHDSLWSIDVWSIDVSNVNGSTKYLLTYYVNRYLVPSFTCTWYDDIFLIIFSTDKSTDT